MMRTEKGFSLIETLIGIALVGMIGVAILAALGAVARSNMTDSHLSQAESLARAQLEYVRSQPYHATNDGTIYPTPAYPAIDLPSGYSFATPVANMVTRINTSGNTVTTDSGLQKITVGVKYDDNNLFTVTGYKVSR